MDEINITGIECYSCHGCLSVERIKPQPFIVDISMYLDLSEAGRKDDLSKTVNYAEVSDLVREIVEGKSVKLIETLAERIAEAVFSQQPLVIRQRVTVHKPAAPISGKFKDVSVSIERSRGMSLAKLPKPISMIACIDEKNGIGRDGKLLVHIKEDMELFKSLTMNQVVIMGRHTMESLPKAAPLQGRINIVLSATIKVKPGVIEGDSKIYWDSCLNGFLICRDIDDLRTCMEMLLRERPDIEFWCIGGGVIYRLLLPYTKEIRLTRVSGNYGADTFFPEIPQFTCIEKKILSGISFEHYIREEG